MLWFKLAGRQSSTEPFTPSHSEKGERIRKKAKLVGQDKNSLIGQRRTDNDKRIYKPNDAQRDCSPPSEWCPDQWVSTPWAALPSSITQQGTMERAGTSLVWAEVSCASCVPSQLPGRAARAAEGSLSVQALPSSSSNTPVLSWSFSHEIQSTVQHQLPGRKLTLSRLNRTDNEQPINLALNWIRTNYYNF